MKLGGFWGMTAPMFVLAFPQKEDAVPFFNEMRKYSNKEALKGLQKELLFLKKIETFPFFTEDLNFDDTKKTSFNLSQSGFENTATFELEKEDFNSDFKQEWQTDFKTLVAMIIIVVASYL